MKYESLNEEFPLKADSIDRISSCVEDFLFSLKKERPNILRVRLTLEEALLRWRDRFGEDARVKFSAELRWRRPTITLSLAGEAYDPLSNSEDGLGEWADALLSSIGLSPNYSYHRGVNIVQLKLKRLQRNQALILLYSVIIGSFLGILGDMLLPEAAQAAVLKTILDPIQSVFFRVLNTIAGPVIFLSVLSAICSVGGMADSVKSSRRMIVRFLIISSVMAVISAVVSTLIFRLRFIRIPLEGKDFNGALDFFLQIIPSDIFSPFVTGDSPQLILLALMMGFALISAGTQAGGLVSIIEQANTVGLLLAEWVNRITPFFVALLLILGIMDGLLCTFISFWKPLVLFLVLAVVFILIFAKYISRREQVPVRKLADKMRDSFIITMKSASVDAGYGETQLCCWHRLGIDKKLTDYGLPLGLVIFMPTATVSFLVTSLYAAHVCGLSVSIIWYIMAIVLTVTLLAATPPVAGVGLLTYATIFTWLGIPKSILIIVMVMDIITWYIIAPLNQAMLQLELIIEAETLGTLDRDILRK